MYEGTHAYLTDEFVEITTAERAGMEPLEDSPDEPPDGFMRVPVYLEGGGKPVCTLGKAGNQGAWLLSTALCEPTPEVEALGEIDLDGALDVSLVQLANLIHGDAD